MGEVTDVEVGEKVKKLQQNPTLAALGSMFSDEGLKSMFSQAFLSFPEGKLATGATWTKESSVKQPFGTQTVDTTHTYMGPATEKGKPVEKISLAPKVSIKPIPGSPIAVQIGDQKGTGEVLFDNQAGRIVRLTLKQELKMEIMVLGQKREQQSTTETVFEQAEGK